MSGKIQPTHSTIIASWCDMTAAQIVDYLLASPGGEVKRIVLLDDNDRDIGGYWRGPLANAIARKLREVLS